MDSNEMDKTNNTDTQAQDQTAVAADSAAKKRPVFVPTEKARRGPRTHSPKRTGPAERPRPEYDHSIIAIRRVARVVAGGRRFSFSVAVVVGNRKGSVGVGLGKAGDTQLAIEKATKDAKKNIIRINLTDSRSIRRESQAKYAGSVVFMKPAPGKGLSAGSSIRTVLDLAGVTDINAKIFSRSKNKLNNARAAIVALSRVAR